MAPPVGDDDADGVPRLGVIVSPSSFDRHPRAEALAGTDLRLVNLLLAALATACVIAAIAGSITH
jgi:hypothetical protein